jgi:excisionase family DNA binding protein
MDQQETQPRKLLITVREAADLVGLGKDTVYRLIAQGKFPYKRIGGVLRVPVKALEKWVEADEE